MLQNPESREAQFFRNGLADPSTCPREVVHQCFVGCREAVSENVDLEFQLYTPNTTFCSPGFSFFLMLSDYPQ